jgi:hypothetical protein
MSESNSNDHFGLSGRDQHLKNTRNPPQAEPFQRSACKVAFAKRANAAAPMPKGEGGRRRELRLGIPSLPLGT